MTEVEKSKMEGVKSAIQALKNDVLQYEGIPDTTLALIDELDRVINAKTIKSDSLIAQVFGTTTPELGMSVTFMQAGVLGSKGTRMNDDESVAQFIARLSSIGEELDFKYTNADIVKKCKTINEGDFIRVAVNNDTMVIKVTQVL